jgi:hypothetical protein
MGVILVSAIVAHTAWHWMIDRWNVLWLAPWPQVTAVGLTQLARWVAGILLAAGFAKLVAKWISRKWPSTVMPGTRIAAEAGDSAELSSDATPS